MKKITLFFPDTKLLWAFAQTISAEYVQINSNKKTITCDCSETEVSRALLQFNAEVVDEVEQRDRW